MRVPFSLIKKTYGRHSSFPAGAGGDFALALLVSHDRKQIRLRFIVQLIVVEAALGWFFLHSAGGLALVGSFAGFFETLLGFAAQGTEFVFGGMSKQGLAFIFLGVLCRLSLFRH